MKPKIITVDRLNENQMEQVRAYLASMPNKLRNKGFNNEHYGGYVTVYANVSAGINKWTAKALNDGYKDVVFEMPDVGDVGMGSCEYTAKRKAERNQVVTGLVTLLAGFFTQE